MSKTAETAPSIPVVVASAAGHLSYIIACIDVNLDNRDTESAARYVELGAELAPYLAAYLHSPGVAEFAGLDAITKSVDGRINAVDEESSHFPEGTYN